MFNGKKRERLVEVVCKKNYEEIQTLKTMHCRCPAQSCIRLANACVCFKYTFYLMYQNLN